MDVSNSKCHEYIEKNYMFYLSIENSICEDYVTEKFWKFLNGNLVPVVLGGANYDKIAPPHSFINAMDFSSPNDLAEYLKYLISNSTAYNEYFKWVNYFNVYEEGNRVMCQICEKLNENPSKTKVYQHIKHWWRDEANCKTNL